MIVAFHGSITSHLDCFISELGEYISNNEKYQNYIQNVTGNYTTGQIEIFGYDGHIKLVDTGEVLKGGILTVRIS